MAQGLLGSRRLLPLNVDCMLVRSRSQTDLVSAQVCNCFDISEQKISACLARTDGSLAALQAELRCGTQCGSCLPVLRRLVSRQKTMEISA